MTKPPTTTIKNECVAWPGWLAKALAETPEAIVVVPNRLWHSWFGLPGVAAALGLPAELQSQHIVTPAGWVKRFWPLVQPEQPPLLLASTWHCQWVWQQAINHVLNDTTQPLTADDRTVLTGVNTPDGAHWLMTIWNEATYTGQAFSDALHHAQTPISNQQDGDTPVIAIGNVIGPLSRVAERFDALISQQSARPLAWYWQSLVSAWGIAKELPDAGVPSSLWLVTEDTAFSQGALDKLPPAAKVTAVPVASTAYPQVKHKTAHVFDTLHDEAAAIAQWAAQPCEGLAAVAVPPTPAGKALLPHITATLQQSGLRVWDAAGQHVPSDDPTAEITAAWYRPLFWSVTLLQQALVTRLAMGGSEEPLPHSGTVPKAVKNLLPEWRLAVGAFTSVPDTGMPISDSEVEALWQAMVAINPPLQPADKPVQAIASWFTPLVEATLHQPPEESIPVALRVLGQRLSVPKAVQQSLITTAQYLCQPASLATTVLHGLLTYYDDWANAAVHAQQNQNGAASAGGFPLVVAPWTALVGMPLTKVWVAGITQQACQQPLQGWAAANQPSLLAGFNQVVGGATQPVVSYHCIGAAQADDTDVITRKQSTQTVWPWLVQQGWFNAQGQAAMPSASSKLPKNIVANSTEKAPATQHPWATLPTQPQQQIWPNDVPIPLSATGIKTYMRCPRQFFYKQWLQLPTEGSAAMVFGRLLHTLLELFHRQYAAKKIGYTAAGILSVWQQWQQLATQWEASPDTTPITEPYTEKILTQWLWEAATVQAELNQLVSQTVEAMEHSGYFSRVPLVVVPEVSVKFTWPAMPDAEWIGTIDALFGYQSGADIAWDVIDFKHDNPAEWRQKTAASRQKALSVALLPLPETSDTAPHAKRFKDVDKRNYQIPLYYAATQADTELHTTLQQAAITQQTGNDTPALPTAVPPTVSSVGLQIVRAPIGEQNAAAAAQVACLQVMLSAELVTGALDNCLAEVNDTVVQPLKTAASLPANPHSRCQYCDYRYLCPEGLAAHEDDAVMEGGHR